MCMAMSKVSLTNNPECEAERTVHMSREGITDRDFMAAAASLLKGGSLLSLGEGAAAEP